MAARFHKILVHIDSRHETHPAVERAVALGVSHGAALTLVDALPDFSWAARLLLGNVEAIVQQLTQAKFKKLQELRGEVERHGVPATTMLVEAPTSVGIIREASRGGYDLVVKEAKGRGSRRAGYFGTTATRLLRKCPCPVLLLKPGRQGRCERAVAAVDATSEDDTHAQLNERIVDMARSLCPEGRCRLDLVHAWSVFGESILKEHMNEEELEAVRRKSRMIAGRKLDELVASVGAEIGSDHVHSLHGDAGDVIPLFANDHDTDLLVLGTVGRSGVAGLLMGNTAERILDRVQCSVLAVKPEGFQSPVRADGSAQIAHLTPAAN